MSKTGQEFAGFLFGKAKGVTHLEELRRAQVFQFYRFVLINRSILIVFIAICVERQFDIFVNSKTFQCNPSRSSHLRYLFHFCSFLCCQFCCPFRLCRLFWRCLFATSLITQLTNLLATAGFNESKYLFISPPKSRTRDPIVNSFSIASWGIIVLRCSFHSLSNFSKIPFLMAKRLEIIKII